MKSLLPEKFNLPDNLTIGDELPIGRLYRELELKTKAGQIALSIALENIKLLDNKQLDYGSKNVSGFGTFGVVVRMNDKFERIKNLFKNKRRRAINESIRDSFRDLSNYAIIAYMVETNQWPTE